MKIFDTVKTALLIPTAIAVILSAGCKGSVSPSPTPEAVGTFTGQSLPELVGELEGTPIYSVSPELTPLLKTTGAAYILVAPQDPLKALIVVEDGVKPEDLVGRTSQPVKLSGKKESVVAEGVVAHVKENYELELAAEPDGKIGILRVGGQSTESPSTSSTATPAEASTPVE